VTKAGGRADGQSRWAWARPFEAAPVGPGHLVLDGYPSAGPSRRSRPSDITVAEFLGQPTATNLGAECQIGSDQSGPGSADVADGRRPDEA